MFHITLFCFVRNSIIMILFKNSDGIFQILIYKLCLNVFRLALDYIYLTIYL